MEYIKKIFKYIKLFFNKDNIVENTNKNNEIKDIELKEYVENNEKEKASEKNEQYQETKEVKKETIEEINDKYKDLNFGDIIFVKRYKTKEDMEKIPIGHREGPAIVISNCNNKLLCVFGSGVQPDINIGSNSFYELSAGNYNLTKKTYFSMGIIYNVTYDRIENHIGHIEGNDLEIFKKKYTMLRNRGCYKNISSLNLNVVYKPGDILRNYNVSYLILKVNKDDYTCFVLKEVEKNDIETILIDQKYYKIDFQNPKLISKNKETILISALENNQIISILKRYDDYLNNRINQKKVQRGSLIKKDNSLYYVYGEDKDKWLTFGLFSQNKNGLINIIINHKNYYTKFNNTREINKNDNFEVICLATNNEVENITNKKKNYNKQKKETIKKKVKNNIKFNYPDFLPGEIVKTKTMCDDKYIIVCRHSKYVYCISIDNIKKGNYRTEYFDIKLLISIGKISNEYYNIVDQNSIELKDNIKKLVLRN